MKFTLTAKAKYWKAIMAALHSVHDEVTFRFYADRMQVNLFNHWAGIYFSWPKEKFSVYEVDFDGFEFVDLGVTVNKLTDIVKRFPEDADIQMVSEKKGILIKSGEKEFVSSVLSAPPEPPLYPKVPYTAKPVNISVKTFNDLIADIAVFGAQHIYFETKDGKLYYTANDYNDSVKNILVENFDGVIEGTGINAVDFLRPIIADLGKIADENIACSFGTNFPLKMVFTIPDFITMDYFIAPLELRK